MFSLQQIQRMNHCKTQQHVSPPPCLMQIVLMFNADYQKSN